MAITYGPSGQPAASTFNYDALVATSLANYRKTLTDNISSSNAFFKSIAWESRDGGLYLAEDLMYALAPVDSYDGYDELPLTPTNGITQAQFQWSQASAPLSISEKERKQNKHRIVNLVSSKIMQAEIGIKEFWGKAFLQGSMAGGGSSLITPYTSPANGSQFVDPLPKLVAYDPSASVEIGGINQSTNTWWRNRTDESAATTYAGLLAEVMTMYNTTSLGPGGAPKLGLCDQTTWELINLAYYAKFQGRMEQVGNYPYPTVKFWNMDLTWDEYVPDVYSGTTSTATYGTMYFLNPTFFKCCYEAETNFVATDFERPINQDAKYKHILWMGGVTINNRRKQGVIGKIARTLT
jgi:hypothetical protein